MQIEQIILYVLNHLKNNNKKTMQAELKFFFFLNVGLWEAGWFKRPFQTSGLNINTDTDIFCTNPVVLTDHIVSKANGAECYEGVVEALSIWPALHVAEDHRWEDQEEQTAHE